MNIDIDGTYMYIMDLYWVQSAVITTRVQNYLQNLVVERFNNENLAVPAMIATYWVPKQIYKAR